MKTNKVSRIEFEAFFKDAMNTDKLYQCDETGTESILEIKPCLVIRDFENTNYKTCDAEYTDLETAYTAFLEIGNFSRIMNGSGEIYADYY